MRKLRTRTEIASAINFRKYSVIKIDLADRDEYGIRGAKVLIDNGYFKSGERYFIEATIRAYDDEKVLTIKRDATVLKKSFGYTDMEKMLEYANAPVVKPDEDILICPINSERREAYEPILLHTGKRVYPFCITPLELERYEII